MLRLLWSCRNTHEAPRDSQTFHIKERRLLQAKWTEKIHGLPANCFSFLRRGGTFPGRVAAPPLDAVLVRTPSECLSCPLWKLKKILISWGEVKTEVRSMSQAWPVGVILLRPTAATRNLQVFPWCVFPKGCNLVVFICHFCPQHSSTATCQSHKLPNHS